LPFSVDRAAAERATTSLGRAAPNSIRNRQNCPPPSQSAAHSGPQFDRVFRRNTSPACTLSDSSCSRPVERRSSFVTPVEAATIGRIDLTQSALSPLSASGRRHARPASPRWPSALPAASRRPSMAGLVPAIQAAAPRIPRLLRLPSIQRLIMRLQCSRGLPGQASHDASEPPIYLSIRDPRPTR
jgi:hypothetical protein